MPLKIILRTSQTPNLFRDILIETACSDVGDDVLLCSGFFQERPKYKATTENNFIDRFFNTKKHITTIGIHNGIWKKDYEAFVNEFKNKKIPITAYYYSKYHWHSKIYLLYKNTKPILGIIGSSNITRNAFSTSSPFNVESDVVLWLRNKTIANIINQQLSNMPIANYYSVEYAPKQNKDLTIQDRLKYFHDEIMSLSNRFTRIGM
jgi:hypothetical protein